MCPGDAEQPLSELHTIRVSEDKALTATTFRGVASRLLERDPMRDIRSALIWGGGRPINIGDSFCGGIGVADVPQNKKPGDVDHEHVAVGIVRGSQGD